MSDLLFSNESLPSFSKIDTNNIEKEITKIIAANKKQLDSIKQESNSLKFLNGLEELDIKLSNAWSPVSHMNSVVSNANLRAAYQNCLPLLIDYNLTLGQDQDVYFKYEDIFDQMTHRSPEVEKSIELKLRDFKLSGVKLESTDQQDFRDISNELSKFSTEFSNNVMDCTDEWTYHVTDQDSVKGVPSESLKIASDRAREKGKDGYLFGLDAPTYTSILKNAKNESLRSAFHYAFATRASKKGPHDEKYDNTNFMYKILDRRLKKAKMLGFKNYAEYSLASKMVKEPEEVLDFLYQLLEKAKPQAKKEIDELRLFARNKYKVEKLNPWDISYYSELQKEKLFNLSDEELKQYFPLSKVLTGLFSILNKIYKVSLKKNQHADVWHNDVSCYDIFDCHGSLIGHIYLDLFARQHKRGGAWMDECRVRCFTDNIKQLPVAYLTCNFNQAVGDAPALLTHYDVVTLFHEFGHCLHHLLSEINLPSISGINGVPWDAVELPSQIHENWCWSKESLALISEHYQTKEPLPDDMLKQLVQQKNYQSGMFLLRQVTFAIFEFKLHLNFHPDKEVSQIQAILDEVRAEVEVLPYADYDQFQHSFSHVFAGGYAAGYYSYLWAEVLAANCFEKFKTNGIFDYNTGKEFLDKILSKGGSIDFNTAVTDFCGREISVEPLLKRYGIS